MLISSVEDYLSNILNSSVVKAENEFGTNGFLFDVSSTEEVSLDAEATDHYVEANYAVQDHIAIKPVIITLKGYMGEVKDTTQSYLANVLSKIESLGDIAGLAPEFSEQAAQVYSEIESVLSQVDNVINQVNNIYDIFSTNNSTLTSAQKAFQQFQKILSDRTLCKIETPFANFSSMALIRIAAINREDTKIISDFSLTFKQIRTVETVSETPKTATGRAADMVSSVVEKGAVSGKTISVSLFDENWNVLAE